VYTLSKKLRLRCVLFMPNVQCVQWLLKHLFSCNFASVCICVLVIMMCSQFFQINNCDHNMLLLSKLFYNVGVTSLSVLNFSPSLKSCWYQYHSKQWLGSLMKLHMNFYLMGFCPILINQRQYFSALTDAMSSIEDLRSHSRVTFALRKNCKHFN